MSELNDIIAARSHELSRGGLWCRGGECGTLDPAEYGARDFRVLIARLSSYEDTSLSFTHDLLYALVADRGWFPDWAFLPNAQDRAVYAESGIPWMFGIQAKRTIRDYDAVALSNSISQETVNIVHMLKNSGVPLEKSKRMEDEGLPLILLGGANAGSSCALFHPDPAVDGIFMGEDLDAIASLFSLIRDGRAKGTPKREVLRILESVPGFFEPDRIRPVAKFNARSLAPSKLYERMPVNFGEGNAGKAVLAISEGCAGFCSFCNESFVRKPYREASAESLLAESRSLKAATGADKIDLFSFNFNMHRGFYELIEGLVPSFSDIGLKSQRFDSIAEDPALVDVERALGKSVFTCGLEGISERLRAFLNKNLEEAQVRSSVEVLVRASVREIKLFLIATGREGEGDYAEWSRFLAWAAELRTPQGKQVRFVFSVTPLVRFPHTPLEFEPTPSVGRMREAIAELLARTNKAGFEIRQAASVEEALLCDQLLRAKRSEVYEALRDAALESGIVYNREIPASLYRLFLAKLSARGLDPDALRADFSVEANEGAPWAALGVGVSRAYLAEQYARNASGAQISPDPAALCGKGLPKPGFRRIESLKAAIAQGRKDETRIAIPCDLGPRWDGLPREYPASLIAGALMRVNPALVAPYRGFASAFWQPSAETPVPLFGADVISLRFRAVAPSDLAPSALALSAPDFWARVNAELAGQSITAYPPDGTGKIDCVLRLTSPFDLDSGYLVKAALKHVYAKSAERSYAWQFTKDALKKNSILSLSVDRTDPESLAFTLKGGDKFDLADFLRNAFRTKGKNDWRRIRVEAIRCRIVKA
jgi:radical SAM superfamily enzyme YgiQ (UPF0313 family)